MNHPTLVIRAVGFDADERKSLKAQIEPRVTAGFRWRIIHSPETDATIVQGKKCSIEYADTPHAELVIAQPDGGFESILLGQIGCPILLLLPASEELLAQTCFVPVTLSEQDCCKDALNTIAQVLRYERVLYALGAGLVEQGLLGTEDDSGGRRNLHVQDEEHQLIAMIDLGRMQAYFNPQADPSKAATWEWHKRPSSANDYPEHFVQTTAEEALWEYAMRMPTPELPARYLHAGIKLARLPEVRPSMLRLRHASLFESLGKDGFVLAEDLSTRNGAYPEYLERDLYALHLCGCLDSNSNNAPSGIPAWLGSLRALIKGESKDKSIARSSAAKQKKNEAQDSLV